VIALPEWVIGIGRNGRSAWPEYAVRERRARINDMLITCRAIVDVKDDLIGNPTESQLAKLAERLERYRMALLSFTDGAKPYAGMARAFVERFESELARAAART
jgi:hypothetical protein